MTKVLNQQRKSLILLLSMCLPIFISHSALAQRNEIEKVDIHQITTGAAQTELIVTLVGNKNVAVVANPASLIGSTHLVDSLLSLGLNLQRIFSPEHGFRGEAEAGETVVDGKDPQTGIEIVSLYGKHKKPTAEDLNGIDLVIFDLQDVGARFYTYISTLTYVMEACAENGIPLIVLDRPNPNGFSIDGPLLETEYKSFVGMHPVPVLYGMTIGEYAKMVNGEGWMENGLICDLTIVPLKGYVHSMLFALPEKPSPNLPNWQAVYLYPSLCFFEGTIMSVGRGTDYPFQIYGHPKFALGSFAFEPKSIPGASLHPKFENQACYGQNLRGYAENYQRNDHQLSLAWLIGSYKLLGNETTFFTDYFELLAGTDKLRKQIEMGMTEKQIRDSWKSDISSFKKIRAKYLLYD